MRVTRRGAAVLSPVLIATLVFFACGGDGDGGTQPALTGTVSGSVTAAGVGVPGTSLALQRAGQTTRTTTSGANGAFSFAQVAAGSWNLVITPAAGFQLAQGQQGTVPVSVSGGQTATVNVALAGQATGDASIRASVTADGSPRSGVTVRLFETGSSTALATGTTAADGTTTFPSLVPGSFDVEIQVPSGFQLASGQARRSVSAVAGQTAEVAFALNATTGGNVVNVAVVDNRFQPSEITISPGTTVRWTSNTSTEHTVTPTGHSTWSSATLDEPGQTFSHTFTSAGTFPYHCIPHEFDGMVGRVIVQ